MADKPNGGPQFLSFNSRISPGMASYQSPSAAELEEMKSKDPSLRFTWTIWEQIMHNSNDKNQQYSDATHRVASFSTVKNFWKYWNHLPQPSELLDGKKFVRETGDTRNVVDALMVFKEGIKPEWEDAMNANGGHFQFQLKPSLTGGVIDEYWNNIVLGMIGGTIEPAEMITGVRLVDKLAQQRTASVRIEVWFSNMDDAEKVDLLQKNLERCMTTKLDGTPSAQGAWGKTERKPHSTQKK
uniref:Eukaryotic translation initiation factor 4E n=1 Tax=Strombidinopsis acuminata TaxID=141414 RepID=A0A7S3S113_9SPIT